MRYPIIILFLVLPLVSLGQELDSFRKTDVVKSRFNIGGGVHFPAVKTDLTYISAINRNESISGALASYYFGVSQDFRIGNKTWIQIGAEYGDDKYRGYFYDLYSSLKYSLLLLYDITEGKHPLYCSAGIRYNHITDWQISMNAEDIDGNTLGQYTLKKDYYQAKFGIGKLIPIDSDMDLRVEAYADYTIGSTLVAPQRGKQFSIGFRFGLTTFFHKWEKVE